MSIVYGLCWTYRVFRWLGPFPTHDQDLWNGTSGEKVPFWAVKIGHSAENGVDGDDVWIRIDSVQGPYRWKLLSDHWQWYPPWEGQ